MIKSLNRKQLMILGGLALLIFLILSILGWMLQRSFAAQAVSELPTLVQLPSETPTNVPSQTPTFTMTPTVTTTSTPTHTASPTATEAEILASETPSPTYTLTPTETEAVEVTDEVNEGSNVVPSVIPYNYVPNYTGSGAGYPSNVIVINPDGSTSNIYSPNQGNQPPPAPTNPILNTAIPTVEYTSTPDPSDVPEEPEETETEDNTIVSFPPVPQLTATVAQPLPPIVIPKS